MKSRLKQILPSIKKTFFIFLPHWFQSIIPAYFIFMLPGAQTTAKPIRRLKNTDAGPSNHFSNCTSAFAQQLIICMATGPIRLAAMSMPARLNRQFARKQSMNVDAPMGFR